MSYNGSGTFQINTSGQPVVTGTVISSSAFNALTADLANGLSTAITKDGQTATTVRIPFAQGINSSLTTDTSSGSTGSIYTAGGVGIAKALYVGTNATVVGTLGVTGAATFSTNPVFSALTASSAVATDASKNLVSVTNTGTGNNVLATSPTLVTPILGTPQSGTLTNCTGLPTTALTGSITEANGGTGTTTGYYGFKNRIINGAMVIDQRNAGASVTPSASFGYTVDRWGAAEDTDGACTVQQIADAPAGFVNSLKFTTTTADASLGATQFSYIGQFIEGLNVSDFAWGSASAQTVTMSFWVKSSLTGTFGGALTNSAFNRSYPFTYAISVANTWEQKTVTIAGDTSGTWLTTNGVGIRVQFGLGVGSTYSGTAGGWAGSQFISATGATSVIGTLSATWQVTGVQLEKGSTATSFDYRPYGTELALCQRYFEKSYDTGTAPATSTANGSFVTVAASSQVFINATFKVEKRAQPTMTWYAKNGTSGACSNDSAGTTPAMSTNSAGTSNSSGQATSGISSGNQIAGLWVASIEL